MKLKALAPAALVLLAGTAFAQDGATPRDQANPNAAQGAAQSEANAQGGAHASFSTADTDKDGRLSVAELQVVMPDVTISDTDADGYVSQAEAQASISGLAFEGDGTGDIGETEWDAIVALQDDGGAAGPGPGFNAGGGQGADGADPGAADGNNGVGDGVGGGAENNRGLGTDGETDN